MAEADYAVVGDLYAVVPALMRALRAESVGRHRREPAS
jgi:electron transfer flavoprotein alpha subunit